MKPKEKQTDKEEMLQMSPWDFDQSPNGWRKLALEKDYLGAAKLIKKYIEENRERIINPRVDERKARLQTMNFHVGQLLALEGMNHKSEAIKMFNQSTYPQSKAKECWNAYVSATIGFLNNDLQSIESAIKAINNSTEEDKRSGNLGIVKNFKKALERGERDYDIVYKWPRE